MTEEKFPSLASVRGTISRAKAEGLPISEVALRRWVKNGTVPAIWTGTKALIYWPNVIAAISGAGHI